MLRAIALLVVFFEAAGLAFWASFRWPALAVCGWIVFVAGAAAVSHNWRREELDEPRGFGVVTHEKE